MDLIEAIEEDEEEDDDFALRYIEVAQLATGMCFGDLALIE